GGAVFIEVPFDSNAGRVLWRSGLFLRLATLEEYLATDVVRPGAGKGGLDHIRVTNIPHMPVSAAVPEPLMESHTDVCVNHLRTHTRRPRRLRIQRFLHALLLPRFGDAGLGIADLD